MSRATPVQAITILALDTALGACSVAIRRDDTLLASAFELRQSGHAEVLMPMITKVCAEAGLTLDDIGLFAVTLGPGTFTGLRIGLAAARGLAQALDRPLAGFSTLETIAWGALARLPLPPLAQNLMVVHDARRSEVYAQCFAVTRHPGLDGPSLQATTAPALLGLDEIGGFMPSGTTWLVGSGAGLVSDYVPEGAEATALPEAPANPDAVILAALAARQLQATDPKLRPADYRSLPPVAPLYLRAPDAKLPGGALF